MEKENKKQLVKEIEELRIRLKEAEETLSAIRSGDVDAIVVSGLQGEQVFTLTGAEQAYRVLIETMNEGAASLNQEGVIIYCNQRLSEMLKIPLEKLIGTPMRQFIWATDIPVFDSLIEKGAQENGKGEVAFIKSDGTGLPVLVSISTLQKDNANIRGITVTDLTAQKHIEEELKRHRDNLEGLVKERTTELEASNQQLQDEITERKLSESALRKSEKFIKDILYSVGEAFVVVDREYRIMSANRAYCEQTGKPLESIIGKHCYEISHNATHLCHEPGNVCACKRTFETGEPAFSVHKHTDDKGKRIQVEIKTYAMKDELEKVQSVIQVINDVTEYQKLEDQLRHAQKMEAVGTLAGGIAHDFNNILNVIMGYGSMILDKLEVGSRLKEQMNEVLTAAERAATLTKRLLVFSRKQVVEVKPVNINVIIVGIQKMLARMLRENIDFTMNIASRPLIVLADAGQLEQVLMNLATNARDAMPEGGSLTIGTELKELDDEYVSAYGYGKTGKYVLITIADTGSGIDAETQKKIFEPFFTTKGIGEGTGLGLAITYGIVKQHNGYIKVYSEPGQGTEFKIYLPLVEEMAESGSKTEDLVSVKGGNETILVAEDDAALRVLTSTILESFGYTVITAIDGEDAIKTFMENRDKIQLVILDMIMPKKSGKAAYEEIQKTSPGMKSLFMSGYTMDSIKIGELTESGLDFVHKPIRPQDLLRKVREILDR